jgi:histidinol-phosphate aminotransferase
MQYGHMRTLRAYRPGRTVADVVAQRGLEQAVKLSSNESAFGPLPAVLDAIDAACRDIARYPDPTCRDLRTKVAGQIGVSIGSIFVGPGSAAVLTQLSLAALESGDRVLVPWPSFELYPILTDLAGATFVPVPLVNHTCDLTAIDTTGSVRMVIVANPNNPTGTVISVAEIEALLNRTHPSTLVVIDEAYADFNVAQPESGLPQLVHRYPNLVVLRTFSKLHGLASLRIGYCVASPMVIELMNRVPPPFAVNGLALAAASASLDEAPELDRRRRATAFERDRLVVGSRALGWPVPDSGGNFVWLPCPDSVALSEGLERLGIIARALDGGLRVTVGTPEENSAFLEALNAVTAVVRTKGESICPNP